MTDIGTNGIGGTSSQPKAAERKAKPGSVQIKQRSQTLENLPPKARDDIDLHKASHPEETRDDVIANLKASAEQFKDMKMPKGDAAKTKTTETLASQS